ncbi:hypothetical protein [Winogradskyella algicola]|uniref:hypothetical protein n=1 Tax=Winogradskyella algicola TaxID=2575815 RepID=UPI0011096526|nr:hypothetical protein [Winogradskyella algicola]
MDDLAVEGEIDEVGKFRTVLTLEDVAEGGIKRFKNVDEIFDISGGRLLLKDELKRLKHHLWNRYGVRLRLVDVDQALKTKKTITRNGKKISKLEDWNSRNVVGSFREGPPPELFLRRSYASELTVFHEMVHLRYWFDKKPKVHFAQEEVIVFDEIWKTKDRWTNQELLESYEYVFDILQQSSLKKDFKSFTDKYSSEINQIRTKIQFGIQ